MSAGSGPGRGGTALFFSQGRVPRSVAFAPAVRGYPGGIADMAGDLDEYEPDLSFGDDELWEPAPEFEPAGTGPAEASAAEAGAMGPGSGGALPQPGPAAAGPGSPGQQAAGQQAAGQAVSGQGAQQEPAQPVSVWQQSAAAWQEAGIDWMRPATAGPRLAGQPIADDDPHTEPIPVLTADGTPRAARTGEPARHPQAERPSAEQAPWAPAPAGTAAGTAASAGAAALDQMATGAGVPSTADSGSPGTAGAGAPGPAGAGTPGPAGAGTPGPAGAGTPSTAGAGAPGTAGAGTPSLANGKAPSTAGATTNGTGSVAGTAPGGTGPARTGKTAPGERDTAAPGGPGKTGPGDRGTAVHPVTGRRRPGRRVAVAAAVAVVLVVGALAGIGIARSGGGPAEPGFTLVTPYPPAVAADAELAGPAAGAIQASLTGIAATGRTAVAIGAEPSQPAPVPLILFSTDGGHTWARATLAGSAPAGSAPAGSAPAGTTPATGPGAAGPGPGGLTAGPGVAGGPGALPGPGGFAAAGTAPALIAHSGGAWLALGQHAAWTSPDGRTWQQAPGLPLVAGDTVLALAGTGSGFVAVGEHTGSAPGPVVWTSPSGRAWQRWSGPARGISAHSGHVTALRWAAAAGGVVVAGGPVTGAAGQGGRPGAGLWRSTDGGLTWKPVKLPTSHGATGGLAGLAADGTGFAAVRPGHTAGRRDAVTYLSAQGTTWRYAGKLTPVRRTPLRVTNVSGSGHGFVVAAAIHDGQVAFYSAQGHGWKQTADPGNGVAGLTAGPGGTVLVAGNSQSGGGAAGIRPHLLLTSPAGRQQVGQAILAAAATPDVTVNSLASAGRTLAAAGASSGSPALWLATAGHWALAGVLLPVSWRSGTLVSVVHGGQGWLAVGRATAPTSSARSAARSQPVVLSSAAGTSWTPADGAGPLTAPGTALAQAAAGPAGYVVVGSAPAGGTTAPGAPAPAAWYSKNLSTWARAPLPVPAGYGPAGAAGSRQVLAVTAGRAGFVAVGSAGSAPAAWLSRSGSAWQFVALPRPAGAAGAVLTQVTAEGGRVVAAGYAGRPGTAPAPFAVVSADGGRTWRESLLPAPPVPTALTALAAAGHGFVAVGRTGITGAGHTGLPGRQVMLAWWSSDGLTWHDGAPAGGGLGGSFVMQINAVTSGDGTLTGAGFAASSTAEHPVLWHARYR